MRKVIISLLIVSFFISCRKDKDCKADLVEENSFIFYNKIFCDGSESFIVKFNSKDEFINNTLCFNQPIPFPIGFDGIIVAQGLKLKYAGPNGGDQGYSLDVSIKADTCERFIDFKLIVTTIDTSRLLETNKNALVLLDGIDSTYTVNFSHEIIPYSE